MMSSCRVQSRRVACNPRALRCATRKLLAEQPAGSGPQALLQMTRNRKLKCGITKRMKQFWSGMARGTLRLSNQHTENAAPGDQLQSQLFPMKTFQKNGTEVEF